MWSTDVVVAIKGASVVYGVRKWSTENKGKFFQLLHKWKGFEWTEECALAFQQLKEYLSRPPIISRPEEEEVLFAYIAVTSYAVSLVLM